MVSLNVISLYPKIGAGEPLTMTKYPHIRTLPRQPGVRAKRVLPSPTVSSPTADSHRKIIAQVGANSMSSVPSTHLAQRPLLHKRVPGGSNTTRLDIESVCCANISAFLRATCAKFTKNRVQHRNSTISPLWLEVHSSHLRLSVKHSSRIYTVE